MKPRIKVRVEFLSADDGGRATPLFLSEQYRPHIRIIGDTEYLGVQFTNEYDSEVIPNEIIETEIWLQYYSKTSYAKIKEGLEFQILEGPKIVGIGKTIGPIIFV